MTDTFHSAEITANGISIKVLRPDGSGHRRALGIGDFATKADYIAAMSAALEAHCGKNLALVSAGLSAVTNDKEQAIAELKASHNAEKAALIAAHDAEKANLEAAVAALGTKPEAQALILELRKAELEAQQKAIAAELSKLNAPAERKVS